jgi:hypothetical protein
MVTKKDINKLSSIYSLPKEIHCNKDVLLDYRLFQALTERDPERDYFYDFDCYLEEYGCNLQRDYVWEITQQREFIMSLLLEKPIESVVVVMCEGEIRTSPKDSKMLVIDGKQRLMTIQKFVNGEFSIVISGNEVYYSDFDDELKRFLRQRVNFMNATVYYSYFMAPVTDDMKIKLFNFYNFSGTPQTEEHKEKLERLLKNG